MTPAARIAAAAEIVDAWHGGTPVERALTNWARSSRYAGSGDRAGVRDLVFDALRRWRSATTRGGSESGRGAMLGLLREADTDPATLFTGQGHAPAPLSPAEQNAGHEPTDAARYDLPDWLWPHWRESLGADACATAEALRHRAPVFLRVNLLKATRDDASRRLSDEGIETRAHSHAETALEVLTSPRKIAQSAAYREGLVELQDAASQAVVASTSPDRSMKILDYCAGGGGKTLALAAATGGEIDAHDIAPARMRDLPDRANRAGARVRLVKSPATSAYDLVLADAPCSGSGAWRRDPAGKWATTSERLSDLNDMQDDVLQNAAACVAPGGRLVYATCSLLRAENEDRIARFLERAPKWSCAEMLHFSPLDGPDGFFVAHLSAS